MESTVPADVNTTFAQQRTTQLRQAADRQADLHARVAAGTLIPLGADRYRINDPGNFDHGEVLTLRGGQLVPQHGLDTSRGLPALYSTVPAWHQLGNIVPGGTTDIDQVLRLGVIDFDVARRPVLYQPTFDATPRPADGHYVTVRTDTGAALGVVGSRYEILQNRQIFEFLQDLVDKYDVVWESAGALRGGRSVFVSMALPQTVHIDAGGVNDEIRPFVVATTSHDGSSLSQVVVTPWRPVCANTERLALADAVTRWGVRHTRTALQRVAEARRTLKLSVSYYDRFAAEEEALARTRVVLADFEQLIDQLWPAPEPAAAPLTHTRHRQRRDDLIDLYRANTDRLGATAYAAERAVTEWADWHKGIRPTGSLRGDNLAARATAALEGSNDKLKGHAHRQLMTLVRR